MKKETLDNLKNELGMILIVYVAIVLAFKLIFISEGFLVVLRAVSAVFWIALLPGYFIMLYWSAQLKFYERFIIGAAVATALTGIISYHLGIFGLHIKYHGIILPILFIILGFAAFYWKEKKNAVSEN